MSEADITRIRELLARYSDGDLEAVGDLVAPAFYTYEPDPDEPTATGTYRGYAAQLKAAAPDLRVDIPDLADPSENGAMIGVCVISGTWTAPLWGVPPDGAHHEFRIPVRVRPIGDRFAFLAEVEPPEILAALRELGMVNPPDQMHLPPPHPVVIDDFIIKLVFTGQVGDKPCSHLDDVVITTTVVDTCEDCAPDEIWPALRMCLTCGHVGCCDTSTNKHAKAHWEATGHPLMRSIRMDEGWIWCYEDNALFERRTLHQIQARSAGG